jgi:hypothetical protein
MQYISKSQSIRAIFGRVLCSTLALLSCSSAVINMDVRPAVAQQSCLQGNEQLEQGEINGEEVDVNVSRWGQGACYVFYTEPSPIQLQIQLGWDENCSGSSLAECGKMYASIDGEDAEYLGRYEGYRSGYRVRDRWGTEYQFIIYDPSDANAPSNSTSPEVGGANVILNQSGSLSSSDRQRDDGQRMDLISIELERSQSIRVEVSSSDFDTALFLGDSNGNVVASNDDISQNNLNSQLSYIVTSSGRYLVGVSSYQSSERGQYQLRVTSTSNLESYSIGGTSYGIVVSDNVWRYVDEGGYYEELYPLSRLDSPRDGVLFDGRTYFCRSSESPGRAHHCTANGWEPY